MSDFPEGSNKEAPMHTCASWLLPRKIAKMVWTSVQSRFEENYGYFLGASYLISSCRRSRRKHLWVLPRKLPQARNSNQICNLLPSVTSLTSHSVCRFKVKFRHRTSYCHNAPLSTLLLLPLILTRACSFLWYTRSLLFFSFETATTPKSFTLS